jgi:hypothetical protein
MTDRKPNRKEITLMKRLSALATVLICLLAMWTAVASTRSAANARSAGGDPYDLSWYTIDGGGGLSTDGTYTLHGTLGQPDAGVMSDGSYTLIGGFWGGSVAQYSLYLPLVRK